MNRVKVNGKKRKKKFLASSKGYVSGRQNIRNARSLYKRSLKFNFVHRKDKKSEFRKLWIVRINIASKMTSGLSYRCLIPGLKLIHCKLNRKILSNIAVHDINSFQEIAMRAKQRVNLIKEKESLSVYAH